MADIMLQVSRLSFAEIGCIDKANEGGVTWIAKHRPFTFNMNDLTQLGGFLPNRLSQHPFKTVSAYYQALPEMHMNHLASQRNDAIDSAEDCRQKYIARCLFRKITREHQLCHDESGPFKDLRPGNVLADDKHRLTGVVDWEFTYAAPTGFAYSPPFWLILELPELWGYGLDDWTERYNKVLPLFLAVLRAREQEAINRGTLKETDRLSGHMLDSWRSGDSWVNYAARKSWAFDMVYWARIDRRFFGDGNPDDRIGLLTPEEREQMDEFVRMKMDASGCRNWN